MAIVFTFHKDRASIIRVHRGKQHMVASFIKELKNLDQHGEYLSDESLLDDIIDELVDEDTVHEKCYVNLSFGTGIQYNTFLVAGSSLEYGNRKASDDERYEDLMNSCLEHMPDGALKLHETYSSSILSRYESEHDVTLSCVYLPSGYYENICNVFKKRGLSLFGLGCQASGINNTINLENRQLIVETESEYLVFNPFGMLVWAKPETKVLDREQILELISEETRELYPVNPEVMNLVVDDITNHLNVSAEFSLDKPIDIIAAIGSAMNGWSEDGQHSRGGMVSGVADNIRKLFKKIRTEEGTL